MTVRYHLNGFPPENIDWERLVPLIGRANAALARYDGLVAAIPNASVLLSPLTTQEAVLSSKIEGTNVTMGEVLEIEAGADADVDQPKRDDAEEIRNYRHALNFAAHALAMLAMTLHNFPEGMAVGVSFGGGDLGSAIALAIGIGLQNIPEGLAIALPLRHGGMSRGHAFFWGQLSAIVEPPAGALGAALVLTSSAFLPYGMAAAAGAMLYVVVEELIPETVRSGTPDVATLLRRG